MSNSSITSEISNSNIEYQNSEGENIEKKKIYQLIQIIILI